MKLYLARHGEPLPKDADPQRRLSEKGRADAGRMADFLRNAGVTVVNVFHSGKARARETAEIMARSVAPAVSPVPRPGLDPLDEVEPIAQEAAGWDGDTLLVGHNPFMERLLSHLSAGRRDTLRLDFPDSGVACLSRGDDGDWTLLWLVGPALVSD